jgi:hypothetical protein
MMGRTHVITSAATGAVTVVAFTDEEEAAADAVEAANNSPSSNPLTMRQLRLGLLLIGGFPATFIQDAITAISDATQRGVAQIWYDESATVEWEHPMTQQLISAAGITTEQAAAMWMQAKDLDA